MKIYHKYILEIAVFACGAVVMIFELVGSRILGPHFGTSIFVWTSLIGIVLGSLSVGYYLGGKMADKRADFDRLSFIIFLAAISIGLILFIKDILLIVLQIKIPDVRIASALASLVIFSPASVLLGMVSPYAVKLKVENLNTSGSAVGNLYAISTVGSIVGTFLAGFYLIPQFGTNKLLIILMMALLAVSLSLTVKKNATAKIVALFLAILGLIGIGTADRMGEKASFIDIDTAYNRIWIHNSKDPTTGKPTRMLGINNENHSSMFLDSDELVSGYARYYHLARHFNPGFKKTLMFGGGGYSFPRDFLRAYPEATMDVVEIDPKITELAKKYFRLKDDPRLAIYHEDGRVFLNKSTGKYDVIFGDAFGSRYAVPYQLTTKEAVQKKYDILNDKGIVILNLISAVEGEKGEFFRAEYATYKSIFPEVYVFPVIFPNNGTIGQNLILMALKSKDVPEFRSNEPELDQYLQSVWKGKINMDMPILTDDYAPVDYYVNKAV